MSSMTVSKFFGGILAVIAFLILAFLGFVLITVLVGGLTLAFWNLWAMLGWLPMLPTSKWIAGMIFFSFPWYLSALNSLVKSD